MYTDIKGINLNVIKNQRSALKFIRSIFIALKSCKYLLNCTANEVYFNCMQIYKKGFFTINPRHVAFSFLLMQWNAMAEKLVKNR